LIDWCLTSTLAAFQQYRGVLCGDRCGQHNKQLNKEIKHQV